MLTSTRNIDAFTSWSRNFKLSIENSVANENTPLLAPPPRENCARMTNKNSGSANENFRRINENSGSTFLSIDQQKKHAVY